MASNRKDFGATIPDEPEKPESPCSKVCVLDPVAKVCLGCYRTVEEIAGWANYLDREKWAILNALPARRVSYNRDSARRGDELSGATQVKRCGQCGAEFACDTETPGIECWCARLPHISPPMSAIKACLCPNCLVEAVAKQG